MTDTVLLDEKIKQSGLIRKHIAEVLGISYYALLLKIQNKNEFKTNEIAKLCELLNINSLEEKEKIFFAKNVI